VTPAEPDAVGGVLVPAQQGTQAGEQLLHRERLGHVVVGASVQPRDTVGDGPARGEHQRPRGHALGPQPVEQLEPLDRRKPPIDQQQLIPARQPEVQGRVTIRRQIDREPLGPQQLAQHLGQRPLVLDQQDPRISHRPPS
jgi:hypothetical protein